MLTQAQYTRLCAGVSAQNRDHLAFADVADLLESYEIFHALLSRLAATGAANIGLDVFDALNNDHGDAHVELVCHGSSTLTACPATLGVQALRQEALRRLLRSL